MDSDVKVLRKNHNFPGIIFENSEFIAINKSPGMLSIPDRHDGSLPNLYNTLLKRFGKIFIIHRLDKDTSGIILFAKDENTHKILSQQFEHREVEKYYLGIVTGSLPQRSGTIEEPIMEHPVHNRMMINKKGKSSITDFEVIEDFGVYSLVQFRIHTGRTHQIRVHMKHLDHPIACDEIYGSGNPILLSSFKKKYRLGKQEETERPLLSRLALHSHRLIFTLPGSKKYNLVAELPKDMQAVMQQLRKNR